MPRILVCWVGGTDLDAPTQRKKKGIGPVANALTERQFDRAVILSNCSQDEVEPYLDWLRARTDIKLDVSYFRLSSPMAFGEIYEAAVGRVREVLEETGADSKFTFHLSPGTSAMAAVWILMAKTQVPCRAELLESSLEKGVQTASVPFDISAEFLPSLLRKREENLERLTAGLPPETPEFDAILHRSASMKRVIAMARRVAQHNIPVLIEGESGTGKELMARAIHSASDRSGGKLEPVNCGAIPAELVESELFGHKKGSFTGAMRDHKGFFERANKGTLFLDEVGELPLQTQVKLLRVLQEKKVSPVGGGEEVKVDVRIIAATNRNLAEEVTKGNFREDLYYRLAVAVLRIPPLRDRKGDLTLLLNHFLEQINRDIAAESGQKYKTLSADARNLMLSQPWPGNIRELQNTLTRLVVWSPGDTITAEDVRKEILSTPSMQRATNQVLDLPITEGLNLKGLIAKVEKHYLERSLEHTGGNKTKAAKLLGFSHYQTFTNWLDRHGIEN